MSTGFDGAVNPLEAFWAEDVYGMYRMFLYSFIPAIVFSET